MQMAATLEEIRIKNRQLAESNLSKQTAINEVRCCCWWCWWWRCCFSRRRSSGAVVHQGCCLLERACFTTCPAPGSVSLRPSAPLPSLVRSFLNHPPKTYTHTQVRNQLAIVRSSEYTLIKSRFDELLARQTKVSEMSATRVERMRECVPPKKFGPDSDACRPIAAAP